MTGRLWLAGVAAAVLAAAAIAVATAGTPRRAPPPVTRSPTAVAARDGAYVRVDQLAVAGGATGHARVLSRGREAGAPFTITVATVWLFSWSWSNSPPNWLANQYTFGSLASVS